MEKCFETGMLKRIAVELERVQSALELGKHYLKRARGNFEIGYFDVAFLMAYNAMLHAAKAAMFKTGVKERSHQCAVAFLKKHFENDAAGLELVDLLDTYRVQRHQTQYDGQAVSREETETIIADAQNFLDYVESKTRN